MELYCNLTGQCGVLGAQGGEDIVFMALCSGSSKQNIQSVLGKQLADGWCCDLNYTAQRQSDWIHLLWVALTFWPQLHRLLCTLQTSKDKLKRKMNWSIRRKDWVRLMSTS